MAPGGSRTRWWLLSLLVALGLMAVACSSGSDTLPQQGLGGGKPDEAAGAQAGDEAGFGDADDEPGFGDAGGAGDEGGLGDAGGEAAAGGGAGSFLGVWRGTADTQVGRLDVEMLFQQDGTFQQQSAAAGTLITIWGDFDVYEDQTLLRLTLKGWEPKKWCGPVGCQEIYYPEGESHRYRFADADTLLLAPASCTGDQCWITYRRV